MPRPKPTRLRPRPLRNSRGHLGRSNDLDALNVTLLAHPRQRGNSPARSTSFSRRLTRSSPRARASIGPELRLPYAFLAQDSLLTRWTPTPYLEAFGDHP